MLLEDKRILFIHVPKTGGTTIGNIIHPNKIPLVVSSDSLGRKYSDILKGSRFHFSEHETFDYYKQHISDMGLSISDFFVFAFVRNPYSRLYSTWKFIKQQVDSNNPVFSKPYKDRLTDTFEEWVELLPAIKPYSWCQKQSWFVKKSQCNFIGRYEYFNLDVQKILNIMNVCCKRIPVLNKTSRRDEYKYYYNARRRKIVYSLFKQDFIEFNYER